MNLTVVSGMDGYAASASRFEDRLPAGLLTWNRMLKGAFDQAE